MVSLGVHKLVLKEEICLLCLLTLICVVIIIQQIFEAVLTIINIM